jgi:hypothetical protein
MKRLMRKLFELLTADRATVIDQEPVRVEREARLSQAESETEEKMRPLTRVKARAAVLQRRHPSE